MNTYWLNEHIVEVLEPTVKSSMPRAAEGAEVVIPDLIKTLNTDTTTASNVSAVRTSREPRITVKMQQ